MPNFRRNHSKQSKGHERSSQKKSSTFVKLLLMVAILFGLLAWGAKNFPSLLQEGDNQSAPKEVYQPKYQDPATQVRHFLPTTRFGSEVHHTYYSLSYSEEHEQAEWVAYELSNEQLNHSRIPRSDWFEEDESIATRSSHFEDYRASGYTKGHLAPAADMAYDQQAMDESFLMSNISPQLRAFNGGVWRELEENVRDWTRKHGHLYVVTGPILSKNLKQKIGRNNVSVPEAFYKVLLIDEPGKTTAIGFVMPNKLSKERLSKYMVTVDEIEKRTGLDFFKGTLTTDKEIEVESRFDKSYWPIDQKRFEKRLKHWNNQ